LSVFVGEPEVPALGASAETGSVVALEATSTSFVDAATSDIVKIDEELKTRGTGTNP